MTGVAFHPTTPTQLVSGGADKTVGIHTIIAGAADRGRRGAQRAGLVAQPAARPDRRRRTARSSSGTSATATPTAPSTAPEKGVTSVAVSRNGVLVAVGGADKKVRLFSYTDAKLLSSFTAPAAIEGAGVQPATTRRWSARGGDGSLTTWDVTYTPGPAAAGGVRQGAAIVGARDGGVRRGLPAAGGGLLHRGRRTRRSRRGRSPPTRRRRTSQHPQSVNCLAFNKDGTQLLTGAADGRVRLFDLAKGTVVARDRRPRDAEQHGDLLRRVQPRREAGDLAAASTRR